MDSDRTANLNEFVVNLIELVNDYSAYITQPICLEMCLWLSHLAGISAEELKNIFQKALEWKYFPTDFNAFLRDGMDEYKKRWYKDLENG